MSTAIGKPPWSREELTTALPAFESIYEKRPIQDNRGGMKAPHMFATWFMARCLEPKVIIESGIWRGQSTWLLEQACPDAEIISIDIDLSRREYISPRATYYDIDFSEIDWSGLRNDSTLGFFDDHQNAYARLLQCKWFGLRDVIFEDNYPASCGDCYSLKKALAGAGFDPGAGSSAGPWRHQLASKVARVVGGSSTADGNEPSDGRIAPNGRHAAMLHENLDIYHEFPPVFTRDQTRWGDAWSDPKYPTPAPLLEPADKDRHSVFWNEAEHYTWICYARIKR